MLSYKMPQCVKYFTSPSRAQINSEPTKLNAIHSLAAITDIVHKNQKQNWWQSLAKSSVGEKVKVYFYFFLIEPAL